MDYLKGKEHTVDAICRGGRFLVGHAKTREAVRAGLAMYFETADEPDLVEHSRALCAELDVDWFVNVQFLDGRLLEINPRISTIVYQEDFNMSPWNTDIFTYGKERERGRRWVAESIAAGDRFVVSSLGNTEETIRLGADPDKIDRIVWYVDLRPFGAQARDHAALAARFGWPDDSLIVLSLRNYRENTNLDVVLRAFARAHAVRMLSTGGDDSGDPAGRVAVAVERRMLGGAIRRGERGGHRGRIEIDQPVPAGGDRLDPLRGVAHRDARHRVQVGLLLHAAGVGQADRRRHAEEGRRVPQGVPAKRPRAGALQQLQKPRPGPGL